MIFNEVCKALERRWVEIKGERGVFLPDYIRHSLGSSPLIIQAPSDKFWVLMKKIHFNELVQSGKNSPQPILLKDSKGLLGYDHHCDSNSVF